MMSQAFDKVYKGVLSVLPFVFFLDSKSGKAEI
jgi:hypothetical protein